MEPGFESKQLGSRLHSEITLLDLILSDLFRRFCVVGIEFGAFLKHLHYHPPSEDGRGLPIYFRPAPPSENFASSLSDIQIHQSLK